MDEHISGRRSSPEHKHKFKNRKEKIGWYIDEIDSYKEDMGKWYTLFIRRILPFMLFIIPINVLSARVVDYVANKYLAGIISDQDPAIKIVAWLIELVIFLAFLVFLPRFSTFLEFVLGISYIVCAFKFGWINTGLGYFTIITVTLFVFMKLVFLVIEILYHIVFRGEHEPTAYKGSDGEDLVL